MGRSNKSYRKSDKMVHQSERITDLRGMYILVAIIVITAGVLSFYGIIEGQAIAGFLGQQLVIYYLVQISDRHSLHSH